MIDPSFGRAPTWSLASCQGRTGLRGVVRSSSKQCVWYSAIISHAVACCIGHNKYAIIYHIYIVYISNMFLSIFWYDAKKYAYTMATEPWWDGLLQRWFQPYHLKNPIFDGQIKHVPKHQPLVFNGFIDVRFVQTDAVFFFAWYVFVRAKITGWWCQPLWKIWVRQWEGWHPIYMKWKVKYIWNHQADHSPKPFGGHQSFLWTSVGQTTGNSTIPTWSRHVHDTPMIFRFIPMVFLHRCWWMKPGEIQKGSTSLGGQLPCQLHQSLCTSLQSSPDPSAAELERHGRMWGSFLPGLPPKILQVIRPCTVETPRLLGIPSHGWPWLCIETTCRWRLGIHHDFRNPHRLLWGCWVLSNKPPA